MHTKVSLALGFATIFASSVLVTTQSVAQVALHLELPSQPLEQALRALGNQTKTNILFDPVSVRDLEAPPISDAADVADALTRILAGSGLTFRFVDARTVTLIPADAATPATTSLVERGHASRRLTRLAQADSPAAVREPGAGMQDQPAQEELGTLAEVVVTAQKRTEKLQDVPSSISVMGAAQLEQIQPNSLIDFASYIPGFNVNSTGTPGQTQITLRGISTGASLGGTLVGSYIDDTPLGSSSGNLRGGLYALDLMPYDVERIEVLRGPQGTLYGASTMGGLVKYVLRSPDLREFNARIGSGVQQIAGSSGNGWGVRGAANMPIIEDTLGIRASGFHQYSAGYIDNAGLGLEDENHYDQDGGRVALLWQPTTDLKIQASALLQEIDAPGNAAVSLDELTRQPVFGISSRSTHLQENYRQRLQYYSLSGDLDMGFATLTSASGWSRTRNLVTQDVTGTFGGFVSQLSGGTVTAGLVPFNFALRLAKFTQELRLTSPTEQRLQWMFGGFYTDEDASNFQELPAWTAAGAEVPGISPMFSALRPSTYREAALFSNVTYELTDRFDITAGLRYAGNRQTATNFRSGPLSDNSTRSARSDETVSTWMVSPRFRLSSDAMFYVRVATGYRPGGPTSGLPGIPPSYASDTLINYEGGFKGQLFDRRLQLDASLFYIDWKDIQITATNAQGFSYAANGGTASSKGIELTTSYLVADGLRLGGTLAYTDAQLTEDALSLSGKTADQLPFSPRLSGSLTVDYDHALDARRTLSLGAGYRYQGKVYNDLQSAPNAEPVDPQSILDLNAGLTMGQLTLRLFLKNALNERAYSTLFSPYAPSQPPQFVPVQPRTIGMSLDASFGAD
jgi:iron complex outermembrane recepter protein